MTKKKSMMLPPVWKAVGFTVAALTLTMALCLAFIPELRSLTDNNSYLTIEESALSLIIISLFVAAMSRDRLEDEMLRQVRLASIFHAFCWVTLYVALYPLLVRFMRIPMINAQTAIFVMLLVYHLNFIMSKLGSTQRHKEKTRS